MADELSKVWQNLSQVGGGLGGVAGRLDDSVVRLAVCGDDYSGVVSAVEDSDLMLRTRER